MAETRNQNGRHPAHLAGRLKLIGQDMVDRPASDRSAHMLDEIKRSTTQMLPDEMTDFLAKLEDFFPAWGEVPKAAEDEEVDRKWNDPKELVKQLVKLGDTPQHKQHVLQLLRDNGLAATTVAEPVVRGLRQLLQISDRSAVEANRLIEVVMELARFASQLDDFAFNVWKNVPGLRSEMHRPQTLREILARFLVTPDGEALRRTQNKSELDQQLNMLRLRLQVLLSTWRRFTQRHSEKFAPGEIESIVGKGMMAKGRYWDRYLELCGGPDREHVEAEIGRTYAAVVEELMRQMKNMGA